MEDTTVIKEEISEPDEFTEEPQEIVKQETQELPNDEDVQVPVPFLIKEEAPDDEEIGEDIDEDEGNVEQEINSEGDHIPVQKDEFIVKFEVPDLEYENDTQIDDHGEPEQVKVEPDLDMLQDEDYDDDMDKVAKLLPIQTLLREDNSEVILPNNDQYVSEIFQLNSITGNCLTLEQQAYGLLEQTSELIQDASGGLLPDRKLFTKCPICSQLVKKRGYKSHINAHASIQRRKLSVLKGIKTRKINKQQKLTQQMKEPLPPIISGRGNFQCFNCRKNYALKRSMLKHQRGCKDVMSEVDIKRTLGNFHCSNCGLRYTTRRGFLCHAKKCKPPPPSSNDITKVVEINKDGGEYLCPCGKSFYRRSRMETCFRSHTIDDANQGSCSCIICGKQFKHRSELILHKKLHVRKRYPCKFCPIDYHTPKELFKHLRKHQKVQLMEYEVIAAVVNGEQKLKCFICSRSCKELSELKVHVLEDHKQPYSCPRCKEKFSTIVDFASHTKSLHPEVEGQSVLSVIEAFSELAQSWKCDECELQFDQPKKLALHQAEQHTNKSKTEVTVPQFLCTDCSRVFLTSKRLSTHRRMIHDCTNESSVVEVSEDTKLMCVHCRKNCKDENALTSHMRLHSPDRKYVCKFCDFRFATSEKRKSHAIIHTGDMKYVCFICEYVCSSENRLNLHKQSDKHLSMKESLITGIPLDSNNTSSDKMQSPKKDSVVNKESVCTVCSETFSNESKMLEHKLTHPFIEFPNEDEPTRIFFK